jgi:pimeloyl-ACP methyl ester carboxylesterase
MPYADRFPAMLFAMSLLALPAMASSQARADSSGYVASGDGTRLHYSIQGSGRDTVLVPGGMLLAPYLSSLREDATIVFYDPRGRGRSDWVPDAKRLTMADEVRDLEAVRAALGISRVALVGFSYLGLVTVLYAAEHPERVTRLALLAPMAPDEQTSSRYAPAERKHRNAAAAARLATERAAASDTADFAADCRRWNDAYLPMYFGDSAQVSQVVMDFCELRNESPARFLWRNDQVMRSLPNRWDYTRRAMTIRVPTLVIQGDRDLAVSPDGARRWTELIPDARLIMLPGAGHLAYIERNNRLISALARFLGGNWPPEAMQLRTSR